MKNQSALTILKKTFKKRQTENPKFSIRLLATKAKVTNGYLSKILSGKKSLTHELALTLGDALQMDDLQKDQLRVSLGISLQSKVKAENLVLEEYELATSDTEWILSKWYITAVLDLITLEDFEESIDVIAKRLEILPTQAKEALLVLEKTGLIDRDENGRLKKKYLKLRFPTKMSKAVIRDLHLAQMKRAAQLLNLRTSQADFEARLVTGLTVASNPQKMKEAVAVIHAALYQAANILSDGPCTEVYQLNLQLFPQTRLKK